MMYIAWIAFAQTGMPPSEERDSFLGVLTHLLKHLDTMFVFQDGAGFWVSV